MGSAPPSPAVTIHDSGNLGEHGAGGANRELLHIGRMAGTVFTVETVPRSFPRITQTVFNLVDLVQALLLAHGLNDKRNRCEAPYKQVWIQKRFLRRLIVHALQKWMVKSCYARRRT
ncbi:hypothetical protein [Paraburkholderia sp. BL6669N2]|uniref:hypothetical protein n=1 Tax=Paraburkholderia sp. BL6669N2 TaxID=1938807 RepID=UPI0011C01C07|nr:hypothetical protein [Paraburkholderia sp. BL6669N2]